MPAFVIDEINNKALKKLASFSDVGKLIAQIDWRTTTLGDSEKWSEAFYAQLQLMLECKFPSYLVVGKENIQFYNDAFIELLGDCHPFALGASAHKVEIDLWDKFNEHISLVKLGHSQSIDFIEVHVTKNSRKYTRYLSSSLSPARDGNAEIIGVLFAIKDITSEVLNKKAFLRNEEKITALLEFAPVPFLTIDENWTISFANLAALKVLNLSLEDIVGYNYWEYYPEVSDSEFGELLRQAMKNATTLDLEILSRTKKRWYKVGAFPFNQGLAITFNDIHEGKMLEKKLSEAIIVRDDFLANSSHELNTPLTSIKIQAQMLQRDIEHNQAKAFEPVRIKKFSQHLSKQVSRLSKIIDDMLDINKIRSGSFQLSLEYFDISALISQVVANIEGDFWQAGFLNGPRITSKMSPIYGYWDQKRIEKLLLNLLNNSLKYGKQKDVLISITNKGDSVLITIKDHGEGIAKELLPSIFERFERVGSRTKIGGLGLGLYISNNIAKAHGGELFVESTEGVGSTFSIELPIEQSK